MAANQYQSRQTFLLALVACLLSSSVLGLTAIGADREVGVYYYPWYDQPDSDHWKEGFLREELSPSALPVLGKYRSEDANVIRQHLAWSEQYGIDHWICSWWALGSIEDRVLRLHILPALQGSPTKFCIYYEATGLLGMNEKEEIVFDSETIKKFESHIEYLFKYYFNHPNYQRIDGKPVLHLYTSRCFAGRFAEGIAVARQVARRHNQGLYLIGDEIFWGPPNPDRIRLMDAITAYCMHGPIDFKGYPEESQLLMHLSIKFDEYSAIAKKHGVAVAPSIFPGYNNLVIRRDNYAIPRKFSREEKAGSTFSKMADWSEKYIDPKLNTVYVTSFNEWHEDTQIEPVPLSPPTNIDSTGKPGLTDGYYYEGYGMQYLEMVAEKFGPDSGEPSSP